MYTLDVVVLQVHRCTHWTSLFCRYTGVHTRRCRFAGTQVYTLEATDRDAPVTPGGRVKYRITSGSRDHFVVQDTTGAVRVAAPLSHISNPSYNITVCPLLDVRFILRQRRLGLLMVAKVFFSLYGQKLTIGLIISFD